MDDCRIEFDADLYALLELLVLLSAVGSFIDARILIIVSYISS